MRDNTPPKNYSSKLDSNGGPHSAPSSPIFSKREQTESSINRHVLHHMSHQQSSKAKWHESSGHSKSNFNNNNYSLNSTKSPALSPASSTDSTSDMDLLKELQQHALFKSPEVDRSVS